MKAGVVVGFLFFVVASVLLWHPTTTDPTGKVTRKESLIERIGSDRKLEQPSPIYHEPTPEEKAKSAAELKKASEEFARLKKHSKLIPMKLVSGEMPLMGIESADRQAVFHVENMLYISGYSINIITTMPVGPSLYLSLNGKQWKLAGEIQAPYQGIKTTYFEPVKAKYAKWVIPALPRQCNLSVSNPLFYGRETKK